MFDITVIALWYFSNLTWFCHIFWTWYHCGILL